MTGARHWLAIAATLFFAGCATRPAAYVETKVPSDPAALLVLAKHGDATAANNLGVMYAAGAGLPQDFAEARKWYVFASEHGNAAAEFNLAVAYQRGQGTAPDMTEALKWYRLAADHKYPAANFALAAAYETGVSVPRDHVESVRLTKTAAIEGFPPAQAGLASLYLDGDQVPEDDGLAYQWASLAGSKLGGVFRAFANKLRDTAAAGLTPSELTRAQAATADWKPGTELASIFSPTAGPRPPRLRGLGSGFVVGKGGEIATDFHVVPNCRLIKLSDPSGKSHAESRVLAGDKADDLAILAGGGFGTRLKVRDAPAELGESITSYGFPLGPVLSSSGNLTSGAVSGVTGFHGNVKAFQITAPEQAGASGGPVVDQGGAVVGIVASKLNALAIAAQTGDLAQNVNFAWRIGLLRTLMDKQGIAYEQSAKGRSRQAVDLAGLLQKATVKIECWR